MANMQNRNRFTFLTEVKSVTKKYKFAFAIKLGTGVGILTIQNAQKVR